MAGGEWWGGALMQAKTNELLEQINGEGLNVQSSKGAVD